MAGSEEACFPFPAIEKSPEPIDTTCSELRADGRIRTGDLILTKDALYLLSYISALSCDNGDILPHMTSKIKRFFEKISFSTKPTRTVLFPGFPVQ